MRGFVDNISLLSTRQHTPGFRLSSEIFSPVPDPDGSVQWGCAGCLTLALAGQLVCFGKRV